MDDTAIRIAAPAARGVRSGHPWVFRDSIMRAPADLAAGACMRIADEEGRSLGWGLVEPEGAIALRVVSRDEQFAWNHSVVTARLGDTYAADVPAEPPVGEGTGTRPPRQTALLSVDPAARWIIDVHQAAEEPGAPVDGGTLVRLPLHSLDWGVRLVLSLRGSARVLEPPELVDAVADAAASALAAYPDAVR